MCSLSSDISGMYPTFVSKRVSCEFRGMCMGIVCVCVCACVRARDVCTRVFVCAMCGYMCVHVCLCVRCVHTRVCVCVCVRVCGVYMHIFIVNPKKVAYIQIDSYI